MSYVKFIRGTHAQYTAGKSNYDSNGVIFFASESGASRGTIYANGVAFGINSAELEALNEAIDEKFYNAAVNFTSTAGTITLTKRSKTGNVEDTVTLNLTAADNTAGSEKAGLMTAAQKTALEGVISDVEDLTDVVASNKIKATAGKSDAKTIIVTPGTVTDNGGTKTITQTNIDVNLGDTLVQDSTSGEIDVNIDGTTITKDANGVLSVASSALTQYVGSDTIDISEVDQNNEKTISSPLKLAAITGDALAALGTNVKEAYQLVGTAGTNVNSGAIVKIYKDSSLKEVYLGASTDTINASTGVITKNTVADPQSLNFAYQLADGTYSLVKIDVSKFLSESEFGNGLEVVSGVVAVKIDSTSESFLTVGANGIKLDGVQSAINTAAADAKTTLTEVAADEPATGAKIVVTKTVNADGHYNYSITGQDLAADSDLDAEVTRAEDIEGKIATATGVVITKTQGQATTVTYTPESGANYGSSTTNLKDRIAALDAQIKTNADNISTLGGDAIESIEVNGVDATVSNNAATVEIDGGDVKMDKTAANASTAVNTGGSILGGTTLAAAITALEAQLLWYDA